MKHPDQDKHVNPIDATKQFSDEDIEREADLFADRLLHPFHV